jgi:hypothetical protein
MFILIFTWWKSFSFKITIVKGQKGDNGQKGKWEQWEWHLNIYSMNWQSKGQK